MSEAAAGKEPVSFEGNKIMTSCSTKLTFPKVFKAVIHSNFHTKNI